MATNITYIPLYPVVVETPVVVYPTEAPITDYSYEVYTYVIIVFVLITFLSITKAVVTRRQKEARRLARRQARNPQTRQGQTQVSSVSATVDANSTVISDPPTTSQDDAHVKVDLPPTYDEVMKHYLEAKEAAANSPQNNENVIANLSETEETCHIDIDDSPPPRYNSV